jgi:hypothetical protein
LTPIPWTAPTRSSDPFRTQRSFSDSVPGADTAVTIRRRPSRSSKENWFSGTQHLAGGVDRGGTIVTAIIVPVFETDTHDTGATALAFASGDVPSEALPDAVTGVCTFLGGEAGVPPLQDGPEFDRPGVRREVVRLHSADLRVRTVVEANGVGVE